MKIWVTGAQGLLGTELVKLLKETYPESQILAPTRGQVDLLNKLETQMFVQSNKPTHVYHLAATVMGLGGHLKFPDKSKLENSKIDTNVFEALFHAPPKWIYYSSSVATYGYPYNSLPLKEVDWLKGNPHEGEIGYAMAKRAAKYYLDRLHKDAGVAYSYGLTTNLFGDLDRFQGGNGHVIVSLLNNAIKAKRDRTMLRPWGAQDTTRDFIYSRDAAEMLVALLGINAGVINIASGREVSIGKVVEVIANTLDLDKGYEFSGELQGIRTRYCDISKLSVNVQFSKFSLLPVEVYVANFLEKNFLNL